MMTPAELDALNLPLSLARLAGARVTAHIVPGQNPTQTWAFSVSELRAFAALVVAVEREACAAVCVPDPARSALDMADDYLGQQAAQFAAAIRNRSS